MTSEADICNRALSEIAARATISSLSDTSASAVNCRMHFATLRRQLLRTAPWGFARKTAALSLLGSLELSTSPYPWLYKYAYPADCLKIRYTLPPPPTFDPTAVLVGDTFVLPWTGPSRQCRFLVAVDDTTTQDAKVILSNVENALLVYNKDVTNPAIWDDLFTNAMVMGLANKIVLAITGNAGMKKAYAEMAEMAIINARVADGNEAIVSTDHTPDWIATRGVSSYYAPTAYQGLQGDYLGSWDNMSWGA